MYTIREETFGAYTQVIAENNISGICMSCIPELGGQLNVLKLEKKGQLHSLLYNSETAEQCTERSLLYASGSHLFPFPNRLANNTYSFEGRTYHLNTLRQTEHGHGLHGYLLDKPFQVLRKTITEEYAQVSLSYKQLAPSDGYPFLFTFILTYTLSSDGLKVQTDISNTGDTRFPFGLGCHPYICTGTPVNKMLLKKDANTFFEVDAQLLPTGKRIDCQKFNELELIGNLELDHCYILSKRSEKATTIVYDPVKDLHIHIWQRNHDDAYNYVQYFIPNHRKCIAIEPMTCPPNALNTKESLLYLDPKSTYQVAFGISLT